MACYSFIVPVLGWARISNPRYSITFFSATRIGVDVQSPTVSEEVESGQVEVCVVVFTPMLPCPIAFPFEIIVHTKPNTASEASNALV